jgi:DNA mismatch repair protein MutH
MHTAISPPQTENELLKRAQNIAGLSLAAVREQYQHALPDDLKRDKGWAGQILEAVLGADAGNLPEPDFTQLGIELKTIPIDENGKPRESTFVSMLALTQMARLTWETSHVWRKLKKVLWVPIITQDDAPLESRIIATPLLWQPDDKQVAMLQRDWQELTDLVATGRLEEITAHMGQALQVRPKAANVKALCPAISPEGERYLTLPRGFYLRPSFTGEILRQHFII